MDNKPIFTVDEHSEGQRLDNFLHKQRKDVPSGQLYKLIRKGQVRINGKRCQPSSKLTVGDDVRVPPFMYFVDAVFELDIPTSVSDNLLANIIADNESYLVVNKPAGLPVHKGTGHAYGVIEALQQQQKYKDVLLAHRLDVVTSGCLVLAKSRPSLLDFQRKLRARTINKKYIALLEGELNEPITVKQNLLDTRINGIKTAVIDQRGKAAETRFEPQEVTSGLTRALCLPVTGRTHQIRAHSGYLNCPIVGDTQYGASHRNNLNRSVYLHAWQIEFDDDCFSAPVPETFNSL